MRIQWAGLNAQVMLIGVALASPALGADLRLLEAVRQQDPGAVRTLLRQHVDVNTPDGDTGQTAVHWAAYRNDVDTLTLLIRAGGRVNVANAYGVTPLALACTNGNAAMVDVLLRAGANPNAARVTGETPLMTCARTGNADAVTRLLEHGADVNAKAAWHEQTALMWAVNSQHTDVVRVLLAHGADVHARSFTHKFKRLMGPKPVEDTYGGYTPLLFAARAGQLEAVQLLLEAGADINEAAADGSTPLVVATVRGHVALAKFLLEKGADPNAAGAGFTPLHWVAGTWTGVWLTGGMANDRDPEWRGVRGIPSDEKKGLIEALLAHGANVNAVMTAPPPTYAAHDDSIPMQSTPFMLAAQMADVSVMRLLLAHGADPNMTASVNEKSGLVIMRMTNITALQAVAGVVAGGGSATEREVDENRRVEAAQLLFDLGAQVEASTSDGTTALHGAARMGTDRLVQWLVDHGAKVNVKTKFGVTPLQAATRLGGFNGKESTQTLLRSLGAELGGECVYSAGYNTKCADGSTAP